jgi:Xaa-Pro dipeptidase
MFLDRFEKLRNGLVETGFDAAVVNPGATLTYLTGLSFHLMERPVVLFYLPGKDPALVLPELENEKLKSLPFECQAFFYGDNPVERFDAFKSAEVNLGLNAKKIAVEPVHLRFLELEYLKSAAPSAKFVDGSAIFDNLRICKDTSELKLMREAVTIAQNAFLKFLPHVHVGKTEFELANTLTTLLLECGSDPELPFQVILSGGPNSANPHAVPSKRSLEIGDLVVVDWGASYSGYASDLTRTLVLGKPSEEQSTIAKTVLAANTSGRRAGKPGLRAGDVDKAARQEIEKAGYGTYFTHRTGHGLGMEGHEPPYMFGENDEELKTGMVYTVEPGIYLPGKYGVRIEDDVVVTINGAESLSDLPRELFVIE